MSDPHAHIPTVVAPAAPAPNRRLWGAEPLLRHVSGQTYLGRVFIEVRDGNDQLVLCGADTSLMTRAKAALQRPHAPLRDGAVPGTNAAAGGPDARHTFLGRVIVELWSDEAVVGITGADPQVLARAQHRLGA